MAGKRKRRRRRWWWCQYCGHSLSLSIRYTRTSFGNWCIEGASRKRFYAELDWEPLSLRWWGRRLTLFYKYANSLTPAYTRDPIPPLVQNPYFLRKSNTIGQLRSRTDKFKARLYPYCLDEWNQLEPEINSAPFAIVFKNRVSLKIFPWGNSVSGLHDPIGFSFLTQWRVGLSKFN